MNEILIESIIEKINLLEYVRKYVKLDHKNNDDYFGICPFHDEVDGSFSVNNSENLWYCFGCHMGGSIIQFVMKYNRLSFNDTVNKLTNYLDIDISSLPKDSEIIKYLKSKKRKQINKTKYTHEILDMNILNKFEKVNSNNLWSLEESIPLDILNKYNVRFDRNANRLIYPIHDIDNNLINIKGRTLNKNFKELGIRKYTYYYPVGTHDFLFGLNFKKDHLTDEVIVFESAKSVMKMDSFQMHNSVSMETSKMTDWQEKILLKLNIKNVIIAPDKGIKINIIKNNFKRLARFVNLYIMYDFKNVLKDKNSPIDQGVNDFKILYNRKVKL